ncbi:MAG: hypothetical protein GXY33_18245 [Phycisphaerae bacterium]|nr:hypothetical protein [Phycisphaerae bacterium]
MSKTKKSTREKADTAPLSDALAGLLAERNRLQQELTAVDERVGGERIEEIKQVAAAKKRAWDKWNQLDQQLHALGGEKILKQVEAARADIERQLAKVNQTIAGELGLATEGAGAPAAAPRKPGGRMACPTTAAKAYVLTEVMSDRPMTVPDIAAAAAKADPAAGWNEDRVRQAMNAYTCFQSMGRGKGYIFRKP